MNANAEYIKKKCNWLQLFGNILELWWGVLLLGICSGSDAPEMMPMKFKCIQRNKSKSSMYSVNCDYSSVS